jgi:pyroglutamyl-peptidase
MELLITGFEPFGGSKVNPSERVIRALKGHAPVSVTLTTLLLPVDRHTGPEKLLQALRSRRPDAVLCLGEASGRAAVSIERIAINLLDFRIPDNSGLQLVDERIVPDGPAGYFSTLPVREIFKSIQNAGIPAEISLSAGAFLCNQIMYELLHFLASSKWEIPAGFIHLPALPEQASAQEKVMPTMGLQTSLAAIKTVIECISQYNQNGPTT